MPVHPNHDSMGKRKIAMHSNQILIEKEDSQNTTYRLKEFADIDEGGELGSTSRSDRRPIIHWVSTDSSKEATLTLPLQEKIEHIQGKVEDHQYPVGTIVQLERIGYAIIRKDDFLLMHE
jgi:hypothetical protein